MFGVRMPTHALRPRRAIVEGRANLRVTAEPTATVTRTMIVIK